MPPSQHAFPDYTNAERVADGIIHILGLIGGPLAAIWLFAHTGSEWTTGRILTGLIYCFGLVGMLSASALYNLAPAGHAKSLLRRFDHAMIFVMIAGTYTPLSLTALRPGLGIPLCIVVWVLAAVGVALKLTRPYRYERWSLALYLGMGWLVVPLLPPLMRALPGNALALIVAGGLIYSFGSFIHTRRGLPFHNALWHAMVLVAAALHLIAIGDVFSLPISPIG